ncbi:MAG: carbohydrate ABC transporter permease [Acidimicrobiales bacterium]
MAFYLLFTVYPVLKQVQISFYHWSIVPGAPRPFAGLHNYQKVFSDPVVRVAALNTLLYVVVTVPSQMLLGLGAAYLVMKRLPAQNLWRTLIFIPVVTSWVIVSFLFAYIFNTQGGLVNGLLSSLAGTAVSVHWLQNTWTAFVVIWLLGIWKGVGWSFVMFLAALTTVSPELVDAARVDGAARIRLWWYVVLPLIRATTVFVLVLLIIGGVQVFISVYLMTSGGPFNSTQVFLTYIYEEAFQLFDFGYAAALATVVAVGLFVLSIVEIRVLRARA